MRNDAGNPGCAPSGRAGIRAVLMLAAVAGIAAPAAGQTIGGTVRESDGGLPIPGAFISLLDDSGAVVRSGFTSASGAFSLTAPAPGRHRLRVERIGYETWTTEPYEIAAEDVIHVTVEVPPRPVRLRDLHVEVSAACVDDPTQGAALATAWEELRKALETAVWAEGRGDLRFTLIRWERVLERRSLAVREATSRMYRMRPLPPFESVPARRLMRAGFVIPVADSSEFHAPDATVLLSPEFRAAHCFGVRRATIGGVRKLGIEFRPRELLMMVQIEGTLWLDEESAELDRVELSYLNLPVTRRVDRSLIGAELVFDRLPDGPFYVREWWIRFPLYEEGSFTGYKHGGGSVRRASGGGESWQMGQGVAAGLVRDSLSGQPLAGAGIVLRPWEEADAFLPLPNPAETPFSTISDDGGRFVVGGLPDGVYALSVSHPRLWATGVRTNETRVVVEALSVAELEVWTPSASTLYERICPGSSAGDGEGAVVGVTRDVATGGAVPGVEVQASWSVPLGRSGARGVYQSVHSDEEGRFAICAVPLDGPVRLQASGSADAVQFERDDHVVWRDVPVPPAPPPSKVPTSGATRAARGDQAVEGAAPPPPPPAARRT